MHSWSRVVPRVISRAGGVSRRGTSAPNKAETAACESRSMDVDLRYVSSRGDQDTYLVKPLKKVPPVLPHVGDGWEQAGSALLVDGRLWSEGGDKVTVILVPEGHISLRGLRQIREDLLAAGWSEQA